jgi:KDO2-lipid IV(A) lauroyltransferase
MTAPALAQMGSRFNCPIVGTRTIRTEGAHFKIEIYPPITVPDTGDRNADITHFMADVNKLIEDWIREYPTQWLWLHNRWPK